MSIAREPGGTSTPVAVSRGMRRREGRTGRGRPGGRLWLLRRVFEGVHANSGLNELKRSNVDRIMQKRIKNDHTLHLT